MKSFHLFLKKISLLSNGFCLFCVIYFVIILLSLFLSHSYFFSFLLVV